MQVLLLLHIYVFCPCTFVWTVPGCLWICLLLQALVMNLLGIELEHVGCDNPNYQEIHSLASF
uniref:Uncharacterized protein LOC8273734 isoform X1 n=1 Tax=Rhizophora mucronata TaxID=61149 RepID=A0A2P2K053_RHIMU